MNRRPIRVLFALAPAVRESFLPHFQPEAFPAFTDLWTDPTRFVPREWERQLRVLRPEVLVSGWHTPPLPPGMAQWEPQPLRYVCHLTGTVRSVVPRELLADGVLVTNWGTAISHTVAEHAILLVLGSLRSAALWKPCLDRMICGADGTKDFLRTRSLKGKRVGIHGFGAIARQIAALLQPFDVAISAYSEGVPAEVFQREGIRCCPSMEELFAHHEVLIECEAMTAQNAGSVNEALLRRLPADAVFVNVGRGALVDEAALARLAAEGRFRIALDIFREEPLPADSPLRKIPNALLSPHCAGPTGDACPLAGEFAMENLRHYLSGKPERMQGVVTLPIYDRIT